MRGRTMIVVSEDGRGTLDTYTLNRERFNYLEPVAPLDDGIQTREADNHRIVKITPCGRFAFGES